MLVQCPECRKDVSDVAKNCPACGFQLIESMGKIIFGGKKAEGTRRDPLARIGVIIIVIVLCVIGASITGG